MIYTVREATRKDLPKGWVPGMPLPQEIEEKIVEKELPKVTIFKLLGTNRKVA